jgi:dienelactone hydrolase
MSSGEAPPPPGEENPPRMGFMKMVSSGYEELVNSIIRPPRAEYALRDLGERQLLLRSGLAVARTDLELDGPRGKLQCSHWEPGGSLGHLNLGAGGGGTGEQSQAGGACGASASSPSIPCVVYMHGNCGCRVEAMELLELVLDSGMSLFSFDFGGCGWSEGEHISLGWFEREDLQAVVCHLRACGRVSTIGLWGRSMGAVTALLHGDRDPTIAGMVLDSPFSSLRSLAHELVSHFEYKVPKFAVSAALSMVKSSVKKRAGFSVDELSPIEHVDSCWIPALFAAANEDDFIGKHHSEQIHAAYAGDKNLVTFEGDHNSHRPRFFLDSAAIFLQSRLFPEGAPEPAGAAAAATAVTPPPHQRHPGGGGGGGGGALATHLLFSPRAPGSPMPGAAGGAAGAGAGGAAGAEASRWR